MIQNRITSNVVDRRSYNNDGGIIGKIEGSGWRQFIQEKIYLYGHQELIPPVSWKSNSG